jgi:cytochrome c oxidase cbb3-type subunit 2
MKKTPYLVVAIVSVLAAAAVVAWLVHRSRGRAIPMAEGELVYQRNCAICHGLKGDGKGEAAYLLQPKPRNFRAGKFRLVTSQNLQPTREDLLRVIADGMPGTAMPSWAHLPEKERSELAEYILKLNWQGWVEKGLKQGDKQTAAERYATEMTQPGDPIPIPPEPPATAQGLQEGRSYYLKVCAKCHGQDGKGKRDPTWRTSEGFPTWARDLSHGVFKGGREGKQLYLRFFTGLPGTPMPSGELPGEQVWQVVHYIQSLSDPKAQEQAQVRTKEIEAERVGSLPAGPEDEIWKTVPEVRIPLMPLWWHDNYLDGLKVRGLYDGERLAIRLEWRDATRDVEGVSPQHFPDGAAVQLAGSESPPLFAMGGDGEAVSLWHWKALWSEDQKRFSGR